MSQVVPSSLAYDICYQRLMHYTANFPVSYEVTPVNVQCPAKTIVLESENPFFLLLVQFQVFTAIEQGKEDVKVEQPQFQFQGVIFQSPNWL